MLKGSLDFSKIKQSNLIKSAGIYTFSNIFEKGIPFALLPILTRMLDKEGIGYYTLYQALLALFLPIFTLSIDSSIILNFYKVGKERFRVYFSSGIYLFLIVFTLLGTSSFLLSGYISKLVQFPAFWLIVMIFVVFFQFLTNLRKGLWQINKKPIKYSTFSISMSLVKNGIGLLFILLSDLGWKGIILGHLIGQIIFALYALILFNKEKLIVRKYSRPDFHDLIKVGGPLSLHRFGAWLSDSLNRIVVGSIIGVSATGSYGIGATFGIGITLCQDAFNRAFVPYLFERLKNFSNEVKKSLRKITYVYYISLITFAVVISICGYYLIGFIFGEQYLSSRSVIVPLALAAAFNGFYKMHTNYIFFTKKTYLIMSITLSMGLLNLGLVYYLVKMYSYVGAAYAALISQFISYVMTFIIANKVFPVFFNWGKE